MAKTDSIFKHSQNGYISENTTIFFDSSYNFLYYVYVRKLKADYIYYYIYIFVYYILVCVQMRIIRCCVGEGMREGRLKEREHYIL